MWPGDWVGIIDAEPREIVIGHVFWSSSRSHRSRILEHGFVGRGEARWAYLIYFFSRECVGVVGVLVVGVPTDVAGAWRSVDAKWRDERATLM
jgi:hypothetical protein